MSTKMKTVKQSRQADSVQDAILEEASSVEDTEEEKVTQTVVNPAGVKPLLILKESYDQKDWLMDQSETEKNRPILEIGTMGNYKAFKPAWLRYREEKNGRKSMVESIAGPVRQNLLKHLQIENEAFLLLSDEKCIRKLDKHFKFEDCSNFRTNLVKSYMKPQKNSKIDSEEIQIYVEIFLEIHSNNSNSIKKNATPKIVNDIFMEGFSPPVFKSIIKKTGSSDLETTLGHLPTLYSELEIYLRWKKECEETSDNETVDKIDKLKVFRKFNEESTERNTDVCNHCTKYRPKQSKGHSDATCYLLHPELAPEWWVPMVRKQNIQTNKATIDMKTEKYDTNSQVEIDKLKEIVNEYQNNMSFLMAQIQTQNEKEI
jgi:hypothetical protein